MKTGDAAALLTVAAEQMQRAVDWLRLSYEKCRPWMDGSDFSIEQAEAAEAFSSRFARAVDMYANKALRALDTFELAVRYQFRREPILYTSVNIDPIRVGINKVSEAGINLVDTARWTAVMNTCFASVFGLLALFISCFTAPTERAG